MTASPSPFEGRDLPGLERVLAGVQALPSGKAGVVSAFGWVEAASLRGIMPALLDAPDVKPAHTYFVDLVEPLPPVVPNHWELGLSDLGETTDLH